MPAAKPVLGLLSGISCVSGVDYYSGISERYGALVGPGKLMPPNPLLMMCSVDCDSYAHAITEKRWEDVHEHLLVGIGKLVAAGIDVLCIASNTGHMCFQTVRLRHPELNILHIADCTARECLAMGCVKVGLLGTEPTMRERYLKDRLALSGIETLTPDSDDDLRQIFNLIVTELSVNRFEDKTRSFFAGQIRKLLERGASGVILGCTEIELLELQEGMPEVLLFRSAELHIQACSRIAAGLDDVCDYEPKPMAPAMIH
jgi:aspartate racemase